MKPQAAAPPLRNFAKLRTQVLNDLTYRRRLRPADAEDAFAEALLRYVTGYNPQRGSSLRAWLRTTAHRVHIDNNRGGWREQAELTNAHLARDDRAFAQIEARETAHALLTPVPLADRRLLWMKYGLDWTEREIGEQLGVTKGSAGGRLAAIRARARGRAREAGNGMLS
jgi:RNA polymerase sigma factor (sigma-70 family)